MIRYIELQNFKCFEHETIPFGNLTLLSGLNGMGKSTVIQAFLLLRQSYYAQEQFNGVTLNGALTNLGTASEVLCDYAQSSDLGIVVGDDHHNALSWRFHIDRATDDITVTQAPNGREQEITNLSLFNANFHYLNAERLGTRNIFEMSDVHVQQQHQIGAQGQYTAHFLSLFGNEDIPVPSLQHPEARSLSLIKQVEAWLGDISPGIQINVTPVPDANMVDVHYSFKFDHHQTKSYRMTNVGFGLTYTLPILVAVLSSKPGAFIMIENPEAHLHPKGQSLMGELFARAAANGIQIIVESHSDHVLNGIRVAVKEERLSYEQFMIHFFTRDEETGEHIVLSPEINSDGLISEWPEYFFDEFETQLGALLMPRGYEDNE